MRVDIVEGVLAEIGADVIINSANQSLNLNHGSVSSSIARAAGSGLQEECKRRYKDPIAYGEVAVTQGYNLKCHHVYHVAIPRCDTEVVDPELVLINTIFNCLEQAHKDKMGSIAMPTLGCGFLGYPPDLVAFNLKRCINMFEEKYKDTTVKQIFVVVFTKAKDWKHIKLAFQFQFSDKEEENTEAQNSDKSLGQDISNTCIRETHGNSCGRQLRCGHTCGGYRHEPRCPPCLDPRCCAGSDRKTGDDDCIICTYPLSAAPVVNLQCSHMYHLHCVKRMLRSRWVGPRITFNFTLCPLCKVLMNHPELRSLLEPIQALYEDVKRKALMRLQYEGLERCDQIRNRGSPYYKNPAKFAMDRYCYYPCFKCKKAYFGGMAQCEGALEERRVKAEDMVCPSCSGIHKAKPCQHGQDYIAYKCRYCCSVAVFFCFGTTHFCNACHNNWILLGGKRNLPGCPAGPCGKQLRGPCPLGIRHPPTGQEFCIGCGLCKNLQTF